MVNILLSTYNGSKYVEKQIYSILRQEYTDFKIYIRDDGSSDNTVAVVEKIIDNNDISDRVVLIRGDNVGFCRSFGKLLECSDEGDYWAFCDQDDYWLPQKLKWAIELLEKQNNSIPILYHGNFSFVDSDMVFLKEYSPNIAGYDMRKSLTSSICYGFTCVINKELRKILLESEFANIQSHDWYAAMIATTFGKILFDQRVVALHILHNANDSPVSFVQKIKRGKILLTQESFYTQNCREFYNKYKNMLDPEQKAMLKRFLNYKYNIADALYKAFYPKRWNDNLGIEIILRCLMLIGKI